MTDAHVFHAIPLFVVMCNTGHHQATHYVATSRGDLDVSALLSKVWIIGMTP